MTPADLADAIVVAVRGVVVDACLDVPVPMAAAVPVERPEARGRADYTTPVALELAGAARRPPRELAEALAARLREDAGVASVDVAGPGFLDISFTAEALGEIARTAVRAGADYGRAGVSERVCKPSPGLSRLGEVHVELDAAGAGTTAGPLALAGARRVAVRDALARLRAAAGSEAGTGYRGDGTGVRVEPGAEAASAGATTDMDMDMAGGRPVTLTRSGKPVAVAGEQAGTLPTLDDVVDAVGVDAARYSLVRTRLDSPLDIDLDLLARQVSENPVFWVRYTHARISSLVRNAEALGVVLDPDGADVALLTHPREGELLRAVGDLPRVVASAARLGAPHRLARYLEDLADTYHRFHGACRVLPRGDEKPTAVFAARLLLAEATRLVLANGLRLLGVSAPERI